MPLGYFFKSDAFAKIPGMDAIKAAARGENQGSQRLAAKSFHPLLAIQKLVIKYYC